MPKYKKQITTLKKVELYLDAEDLIQLVKEKHGLDNQVISNIRVNFDVPQGGDYSGMRIAIDEESPVVICYEIVSREVEG